MCCRGFVFLYCLWCFSLFIYFCFYICVYYCLFYLYCVFVVFLVVFVLFFCFVLLCYVLFCFWCFFVCCLYFVFDFIMYVVYFLCCHYSIFYVTLYGVGKYVICIFLKYIGLQIGWAHAFGWCIFCSHSDGAYVRGSSAYHGVLHAFSVIISITCLCGRFYAFIHWTEFQRC